MTYSRFEETEKNKDCVEREPNIGEGRRSAMETDGNLAGHRPSH
jgi:hypothetical protein